MRNQLTHRGTGSGLSTLLAMKYILIILLLPSCRYQWYSTDSKISTVRDRVVITPLGKSRPIGDTTVTGITITRKRIR